MSRLIKLTKLFFKDESGAALVEYAVIFAVLIAGTVAALTAISPEIVAIFNQVTTLIAPLDVVPPAG